MLQRLRTRVRQFAAAIALGALTATSAAQSPAVRAELPVLITSAGQSLDAFTVKTLLGRNGVAHDYKALAKVADLGAAKTLVIAFGASVKGFGSAGVTADTEMARVKELLATAQERKIKVIGVHIGGAERRSGLSKQFVDLVAPASAWLVVWEDGNADGFFTKLAAEKKIPLELLKQPMQAGKVLASAFGK